MRANQITRITSDFKMDVVKVNYDFLKNAIKDPSKNRT